MATYKTPGVYVEEISTLPASVAQVETAIPAFIGWTEKAEKGGKSLKNVPTRIKSLVEYKELFGGAAPSDGITITNPTPDNITVSLDAQFYLFNSLKLFYANGGGPCYIVSIGSYENAYVGGFTTGGDHDDPSAEDGPMSGLKVLEKYDEPTLIVCPDAITLNSGDYFDFYKKAMAQCEKLKDRFTVIDLLEDTADYSAGIDAFRNGIGVSNLKYGAAYTPNVVANLDVDVRYRDLTFTVPISTQTNVQASKDLVTAMSVAVNDTNKILGVPASATKGLDTILSDEVVPGDGDYGSLKEKWERILSVARASIDSAGPTLAADITAAFQFFVDVSEMVQDWEHATLGVLGANLVTDVSNQKAEIFKPGLQDVIHNIADSNAEIGFVVTVTYVDLDQTGTNAWTLIAADALQATYYGAGTATEKQRNLLLSLNDLFDEFNGAVYALLDAANLYEDNAETNLYNGYPLYKKIVDMVAGQAVILPPSGAVVGQYATVDRTRGVWKAPANVSLTGITGLTYSIDNDDQDGLNVDVNAGKSINAIRAFTGKGILIWGARTLAGNDNEWRYVPVRRLYIMVEESIKKATEFVVFEPNDANTWVRVRGMISSYLTELWRQGALAGAKPSQAFFVNVGLGETMTPQDILEGRLIIEIGMAAVRPAEFIILKFSHKLQES